MFFRPIYVQIFHWTRNYKKNDGPKGVESRTLYPQMRQNFSKFSSASKQHAFAIDREFVRNKSVAANYASGFP